MIRLYHKKHFFLMVVVLFIGLLLAGCSGGDSTNEEVSNSEGQDGTDGESQEEAVEEVTLRLAHQWTAPTDGEGDYRSLLAEKFAEEVANRSDGSIEVQVYPANSLIEPDQQFTSLQGGSLDLAIWPAFYEAGRVPELSITMMPGISNSAEELWKWPDAEIGEMVENLIEDLGAKVLTWTWAPGTVGTIGDKKIEVPEDMQGFTMRGAGKDSELLLESMGASIASMPSSEIYSALQTGVLDSVITTYSSFLSYSLYEVLDSFLNNDDAIIYGMMPLAISQDTWENKLSEEQRNILEEVGKELESWVVDEVAQDNEEAAQVFEENGVEVYQISDEQFQKWVEASQPIIEQFAEQSDLAAELVEAARSVE